MKVHVSATLKVGKLIKGNHEWPIRVGFKGDTDMQSFYLCLNEDDDMELDNLMQDMLGDAGTELMPGCRIEDAGIFYVNKPENEQQVFRLVKELDSDTGDEVCALMEDSIVKDTIEQKSGIYSKCICMWLVADLQKISVLKALIQLGYSDGQKLVMLVCLFMGQNNFLNKGFFAKLPDIKLLKLFEFNDVKLKYVISGPDTKSFALSGQVGISIGEMNFKFAGDLTLDDKGYDASLSNVGKANVLAPFAGMVNGPSFDNIFFYIQCVYKTEYTGEKCEYFLSGDVAFAGIKTSGLIYFDGNDIILAKVKMDSDFSLAVIWNQIFSGQTKYNPAGGTFDMKFLTGSEMYYCSKNMGVNIRGQHYEKGFVVRLFSELTLIYTVSLEGVLKITDDSISASLYSTKPINLGIIRIDGITEEGVSTSGPGISFILEKNNEKDKQIVEISGNIFVFNESITGAKVQYYRDKDKWEIRAELVLPETLQQFFCKSFIIVYSSENGFGLENADNFSFSDGKLDFLKVLEKYTEKSKDACGSVFNNKNNKVQVKFDLKPGISGKFESKTDWSAELTLNGKVRLEGGSDNVLFSTELDPVSINIDSETTFYDFPDLLVGVLEGAVNSIINMLFQQDNFEFLEKIFIYLFEKELEQYVEKFVCRKLLSQENAEKLLKDAEGGSGGGDSGGGDSGGGGGSGGGGYPLPPGPSEPPIPPGVPILPDTGGGKPDNPDNPDTPDNPDKLACPYFTGQQNDYLLTLNINEVEGAIGYRIDVIWENPDRKDYVIDYKNIKESINISLLEISVLGSVYIAVCALHEKDEFCSDWNIVKLSSEVTLSMLIAWAYGQDYCIRDCYGMLSNHGIDVKDMTVLEAVLKIYGDPDTPESIAKDRLQDGDDAMKCLIYINNVYPNLTGKEIMTSMCKAGYEKYDAAQALVQLRPGLSVEELLDLVRDIY